MDLTIILIGLIGLVVVIVVFVLGLKWKTLTDKNYLDSIRANAEREKQEIIENGKIAAELAKKEALLEAKENLVREKLRADDEIKQRKEKIYNMENDIRDRMKALRDNEHEVEEKEKTIYSRENFLAGREKSISFKEKELSRLTQLQNEKLERVANMTQDEARKILLQNLEHQIRHENAEMIKKHTDEAKEKADEEAKEIVLQTIQRVAADVTVDATVAVVHLPSEDMKGRIIGREGRNIRSFEEFTGVDVIVDDTPDTVVLSCFDPVRREVARLSLEQLIGDGRIHPGRIEEVVNKMQKEITKKMKQAADEIMLDLDVHGLKPKIVELLGRLKYRTSYGQNVLQHSHEVAVMSGLIASQLGYDPKKAIRAGLLHDIGKSIDRENEGTHSALGATIAEEAGEDSIICNAIAAHHEDVASTSVYSVIIQAADTISSSRPGVRKETLTNYVNRLTELEAIATSFKGVEKAFVIQAGREVRVMVMPGELNDAQAEELARELVKKIEAEMGYPGTIKVTTIREVRHTEVAK
ncbi:MAG: ribonuclease Y [Chitinivibrionia bacterium]|nr:ribonuclease Y [Chitinivibrionia bacterium]